MWCGWLRCCVVAAFCTTIGGVPLSSLAQPVVSIIIDDLGNRHALDRQVIALPGAVTCSILPRLRWTKPLARAAHHQHKEVMLHAPMQAIVPHDLGPGGLRVGLDEDEFTRIVQDDLASLSHVRGLNNHMGSLLTQSVSSMHWLMTYLATSGIYFVDSRTSADSVAAQQARALHVPMTTRDIFLDNVQDEEAIRQQYYHLLRVAKRHGSAVAIGHPYPSTIRVLQQELPQLAAHGYRLIPISELIALQQKARVAVSHA